MITIKNLTKQYGKIKALNSVNFVFNDSEVIAIMGENGAGKSTLLKICAGIIPFDKGEVTIDGFFNYKQLNSSKNTFGISS